jgi:hypothetical protein
MARGLPGRRSDRRSKIMTTRTLDKASWQSYFDGMAKALEGKRVSVEVTSPDLGDQVAAQHLPLFGITYDPADDLIEIAMEGLDHLVQHPRQVSVDEQGAGLASIEVVASDGAREIVTFQDPLLLPGSEEGAQRRLILGSRVTGTPVVNQQGERIGHIDDLSIDRVSGQVVYAIMSFGGFLGIGEKFHPLPWSMLDYDPVRGGYSVTLDRAALEGAPHYERDELEAFGGSHERFGEQIFNYYAAYGYVPHW